MEKTASSWFILEIETGKIDGWYSSYSSIDQNDLLEYWHKARPGYSHIIAETSVVGYLPDERCLNRS